MSSVKHYPKGVISLSMIECFERFGFYATQGILVLYAAASLTKGGLDWSNAEALRLTGIFSAVVYATPVVGGWVADKFIGRKNGMLLGNILLFTGYLFMMQRGTASLYIALIILAIGTGFLKPTISAMVGEFYDAKEDSNRDAGFAIFYMSINIGGFFGPFVAGFLVQRMGYSYAFGSSAVGMAIALANTFISYGTTLKGVGKLERKSKDKNIEKIKWTFDEKKRVWVYIAICVSNILWNIFYTLPYGLLNLWAEGNINRHVGGWQIPTAWFYASYAIMIVIFSPVIAKIYKKIDDKKKDFTLSYKLAVAYLLLAIGCTILMPLVIHIAHNIHYIGSMSYLIAFYVLFSFSELLTVPVLLSAATKFAPKGFSATLVSLNMLISWSIGGYLGGEVSAMTQTFDPTVIFIAMIAACIVFFFGHIITNRFVERNCNNML
ncbi:MAG TPA: peptide MFS transporter [Victivallales bacterium]|nr:peptide MFS transporter [Victivallales bacterium]